jgi:hypothetical protein
MGAIPRRTSSDFQEAAMRPLRIRSSWGVLALAAWGSVLGIGPAVAGPIYVQYNVTNDDPGGRIANDLEFTFNKTIQVNKQGQPTGARSGAFEDQETKGANGIHFSDGTVLANRQDVGIVALNPGEATVGVKVTSAEWSYVVGANRAIAKPDVRVLVGKKDNGAIVITNDEPTLTVYFSTVRASADLPASLFLEPSESQLQALIENELYATGVVPDFSLLPGERREIDLGLVTGENYTSVVFTMDFSPTPSASATRLAFAGNLEIIPEPSTAALAAIGLGLGLAVALRRRRAD